nr:endoglucanase 24 [Quercus suber]
MGAEVAEQTKSKGWCWYLIVFVIGALVVAAATLTILKNFHNSAKPTSIPGAIVEKYADALEIALQFFDVQKSAKLVNNRIAWRGDSGLRDGGNEENLDLSRGMYDAGDLIKFGFPMAFTATVLSWAILEYGDHMNAVKQLEHAQDSLKWITDYLINAHPSANVLYVQVGDPEVDHNCWERPEAMTEKRPLVKVNMLFPGAEVAAETAAAMASASMVFKKIYFTYSSMLFMHAQQLFILADTYQGSYSVSILQVQKYYNSTGYGDELLWAATWLYHATGKQFYLRYVLLSRINFFGAKDESTSENLDLQLYRESAEAIVCALLPDSPTATSSRTEKWNSLQHPVASAFLAVLYGDYMLTTQTETLYYIDRRVLYTNQEYPTPTSQPFIVISIFLFIFIFIFIVIHPKGMAAENDIDLSNLKSQLSQTHEEWKHDMERSQSQVDVLQTKIMEVKISIQGSEEDAKKELEVLWRRVKTTATLLTYLKSKAQLMAVPHLAHTSCGIKQLEGVGFIDKNGTPLSSWTRNIDLSSFDGPDEETLIGISGKHVSLDEQDATYTGEILKSVQMVTDVMEALVKRVILAESETVIEKEKVTFGQEEIKRKSIQIENMSLKLEEMERFALGTNSILNEMRQRVEDLVEETSRQRQRAAENEQELCRVKRDFESLKSYVSSLITVRETLLSSEKQFQTIEKLFERLVAKTTQLEGEKMQKETEVQKLMEENVRLSALLDKKEAQLLAMNEQCKFVLSMFALRFHLVLCFTVYDTLDQAATFKAIDK